MADIVITSGGAGTPSNSVAPGGRVQSASNEVSLPGSRFEEGGQQVSPTFTGVLPDKTTLAGDGLNTKLQVVGVAGPTSVPIKAGAAMPAGTPFYVDANGLGQPAVNDTHAHAAAIGVLTTSVAVGDAIEYALLMAALLASSVWASVTGEPSGLTPGASYYVGAVAGTLTKVSPGGGLQITRVGVALNATTLLVLPTPPVGNP